MIYDLSWMQIVGAVLVIGIGSAIQGAVGFGSNVFAAPVLLLFAKSFVPAPVLFVSVILNLLMAQREGGKAHWNQIALPAFAFIPGSLFAIAIIKTVSKENLSWIFGIAILCSVACSIFGLHPKQNHRNFVITGMLSGLMGTSIGVSGPPIALLYQHEQGPEIRASLSRYFLVTAGVSLVLLLGFGQVDIVELIVLTLILLPGTITGFYASKMVARYIDAGKVRIGVLSVSGLAGSVAVIQGILS